MQKSAKTGVYFDYLVTDPVMGQICIEVTGQPNYEVEFVENDYTDEFLDAKYNQGRLAILQYHNTATYISFSDEKCDGRNSGIQSVPTAFNRFYSNAHKDKRLYFYFLPCSGNNATPYYLFMYRLMKTAGFDFINTPSSLEGQINAFTSIEDIIRARKENGDKNSGNNATYILKNAPHEYEIFGKTYGANKYDTSLICYAISRLAQPDDHITLYEYNEKDLKELPAASLEVLHSMGNIDIVNIDDEIERKELEENDSLRSPRFNAHLLDRLGEKHCVLCNCGISEIIQGAHIWPVSNIKRVTTLSLDEKVNFATDGENGLWMCQNHHKLFDSNILFLSKTGEVSYKEDLSEDDENYIESITTVSRLQDSLITPSYVHYIDKRYAVTT
jgi:hypothetical protein